MRDDAARAIGTSVRQLLARRTRLVLAVSGGADSAVLLDAVARFRGASHHIVVASVDHGTGPAATDATALAVSAAARLGLPVISERLRAGRHDEATLRNARWAFLRKVAAGHGASVVTGHTRDDQIETVVMRTLRGAGARGIAGLLAPSPIERPLLEHRREAIRRYAAQRRVEFIDDPSNQSLAYFRNRLRLQLLPAIRHVNPGFEDEMLALSRRAAALRAEVDVVASSYVLERPEGALLALDAAGLADLPDESLRLLLPAIVAHSGVALDRRGIVRLASLVTSAPGMAGHLSGGYQAVRTRDAVTLARRSPLQAGEIPLRRDGETRFGDFRFRAETGASIPGQENGPTNAWRIYIPTTAEAVVRQWHPGDRLTTDMRGGRRRVKRFFADAGIVGPLRSGWPVVLCSGELIWIPGIKASQEAVRHEGRMVRYICERVRE